MHKVSSNKVIQTINQTLRLLPHESSKEAPRMPHVIECFTVKSQVLIPGRVSQTIICQGLPRVAGSFGISLEGWQGHALGIGSPKGEYLNNA